jgi:hypothetical protein
MKKKYLLGLLMTLFSFGVIAQNEIVINVDLGKDIINKNIYRLMSYFQFSSYYMRLIHPSSF